jgi:hypothetical protein
MTLSDQELILYALREAQLILADCDKTQWRDLEKTIRKLQDLLNRNDVVEAVDRLQEIAGLRLAEWPSNFSA